LLATTSPVFTFLLAAFILKEGVRVAKIAGLFLSFGSVALVVLFLPAQPGCTSRWTGAAFVCWEPSPGDVHGGNETPGGEVACPAKVESFKVCNPGKNQLLPKRKI
jgi:hypothetical protein